MFTADSMKLGHIIQKNSVIPQKYNLVSQITNMQQVVDLDYLDEVSL